MLRALRTTVSSRAMPHVERRYYSSLKPAAPKAGLKDVNAKVIAAEYAVRGLIPARAEELREKLRNDPGSVPFKSIINANIGNPQQLKQKPLTFYRSVLSILQNPSLLEVSGLNYPQDVIDRAKRLLGAIGSVGAYSHSQGVAEVRRSVANFITERDQDSEYTDPANIYLTTGASDAVKSIFQVLLTGSPTDGVLIPIPQYPLYTAEITLKNATPIPYYLNEETNWSVTPQDIDNLLVDSKRFGIKPKILVVINPGNPTGSVLSKSEIQSIIGIAAKHGVVIIADEVYQENIFEGEFHSFKKVLVELQRHSDTYDNVQLASLHSISKGVSGECGQRGGYMELYNFKSEIYELFTKISSIALCPVATGQALMEMMVNPPKPGDASYETDQAERQAIHASYQKKADLIYHAFKALPNIEIQKPQGAMYLFPQIIFTDKIIGIASEKGLKPDEYYCLELLENTGICVVPGSGFGQVEGTYHVRTTFLPEGEEWIRDWARFHENFFEKHQ